MGKLPANLGPYHLVRQLGEGGMGAVYEARQEPLDRRVALKILHPEHAQSPEATARFFNEAKILSRLEHPSIVQIFDFGHSADGNAYLAMEYLRGESLARRLHSLAEQGKRLAVISSLQLVWQAADVLAVAHAQGIVHRDLKPDNLMLVADPVAPGGERVKLLDFGIAKLTKPSQYNVVKTDTQALVGTPMYMSPEQCAGAGGVDDKTDVYSLGCVLYEMLSGQPPFVAEGAGQLVGMHLFREPAPLASLASNLPPKVADLVHRLLIKDKSRRPSMAEACDELGRLLARLTGGEPAARSRPSDPTDPGATHPLLREVTTLGQSSGQRGASSAWPLRLFIGSVTSLLLCLLVVLLWRSVSRTASTPVSAHVDGPPADDAVLPKKLAPPPETLRENQRPVEKSEPPLPIPTIQASGHPSAPRPTPSTPSVKRPKSPKPSGSNGSIYVD